MIGRLVSWLLDVAADLIHDYTFRADDPWVTPEKRRDGA